MKRVLIFALALATLVPIYVLATSNRDAMATCLERHSVDTCHAALNR
jgi:hypothetical protein